MEDVAELVAEPQVDYTTQPKSQFLDDLENRLQQFKFRCINVSRALPKEYEAQHFARQLLRSSSSVTIDFRAIRRSRNQAEYVAKVDVALGALDEPVFWLETLAFTNVMPADRLHDLTSEGHQIATILSKSRKSVSD
jgi:four helix bundle protein